MVRQRKIWDTDQFDRINLPEVVGRLNPENFAEFNGIRVLDMPIFMPGQGWNIPLNLSQFQEVIDLAVAHESQYGDLDQQYVYITVDQKVVHEGKTGRRAGAHSDAYVETNGEQIDITTEHAEVIASEVGEVSHTYIAYDKFPTEFFAVPFPLTDSSCQSSLRTFDQIADSITPVSYPAFTLLKLDPYVVHRCSICTDTTNRTFVKISFSRKQYARIGNTINPEFDYDWHMTVRSPHERNHPWS